MLSARPGAGDAAPAGSFIRGALRRVRSDLNNTLRICRSYGPVTFDIVASGFGLNSATIDHLFRYAAEVDDKGVAMAATLYLCNGEASTLGSPPETWPFAICDAASFHRTYWSAQDSIGLASDERHGLWYMADLRERESIFWMRDASELPEWEETAPLRHCFHWCAHSGGAVVAHAAAFGEPNGFVLVTGPGGSGKSILSLSALGAGLTVLSEDLCWIELAAGRPVVYRLYDNIKIAHTMAGRFRNTGWPIPPVSEPGFSKAVLRLPRQQATRGPIRALFCLSGTFAEQTIVKPCSKAEAYRLLAPSTVFLMRTAIVETSTRLKNLVEMLPTFALSPGADPAATAKTLLDIARGLP